MQTTDNSRKRARNDGVPDIPGVSSHVGPFLTAAITETTKAYQHLQTVLSLGTEEGLDDSHVTTSRTTNNNALEHVMDRFRTATAARDDKLERLLEGMKAAIDAWENAMKRDSKTMTKNIDDEVSPKPPTNRCPWPLSCTFGICNSTSVYLFGGRRSISPRFYWKAMMNAECIGKSTMC
jgi:hypothetical protein